MEKALFTKVAALPWIADGMWNQKLTDHWTKVADFILIEERFFKGWIRDAINSGGYQELNPIPPSVYCRSDSRNQIFKRLP